MPQKPKKKPRLIWKDESTRSQDGSERTVSRDATIWRLRLGTRKQPLDITVHRHVDTGDTVWYLSVRQLIDLNRVVLKSEEHIKAKEEAIRRVFTYLTGLLVVATKAHADVSYDHEEP